MATGLGLLFANLEKFNGSNADLIPWLRQFDRCCVVANKTDENVKGQLLLICCTGQAKAILENFEEEQGTAQNYTALKGVLENHYNTHTHTWVWTYHQVALSAHQLANSLARLKRP